MSKGSKNLEYEIRERKIKKILKENGAKLVQKKTIMPLPYILLFLKSILI